jgi:hypothetical protein
MVAVMVLRNLLVGFCWRMSHPSHIFIFNVGVTITLSSWGRMHKSR